MFPGAHAATFPNHLAARVPGTGEVITYGQLEQRSTQLAHVLAAAGLRRGDVLALVSDNDLRVFEIYWAAMRSGLYITMIDIHLDPEVIDYIITDSGAAALIVNALVVSDETPPRAAPAVRTSMSFNGTLNGYSPYEQAIVAASPVPFEDQPQGRLLMYSSGTTGRPKGVRGPLPVGQVGTSLDMLGTIARTKCGVGPDTVFLSPAPIYHTAPLRWCASVQALGGTVILPKRFDAEGALRLIQEYGVTHAQFVPTMFVRMLKLPSDVRSAHDLSTLQVAIHSAAPCPVDVKRAMIDWFGPCLLEYYAGTEANGMTMIDSQEWLEHPGSVGRPVIGTLHVCGGDGTELPAGETGDVYFERNEVPFQYINDAERTGDSQHPKHPTWTTMGDVGRVEDGYLYLTDRKSFMIISGGVNIYPQEIENILVLHPAVADIAVIGVPHPDLGEVPVAIVQLASGHRADDNVSQEIVEYVRSRLGSLKVPRAVHFVDSLPRSEGGKLAKRKLVHAYSSPVDQTVSTQITTSS